MSYGLTPDEEAALVLQQQKPVPAASLLDLAKVGGVALLAFVLWRLAKG